ncbi:hypothetical protein SAMN02745704_01396 [Paucidesulfovibrio gracilis DSM 16080]|uniref:Uncharacterized protein n=1 Tax=Paucidesulfovibrio gracilis DSM 16080 TaxID=1121449 RepID=A0A1T4WU06_9BACT|nr:hypothetical protein [Paucidesulfovibrio gracilis]SKA80759.1 hypothetical protein SAMN02745704_01396 [Paucidesulfovibrio gracilis DSM 16080]
MARYTQLPETVSLEDQIKTLADEELLDFWEETQQLGQAAEAEEDTDAHTLGPEFERIILLELQMRSCRRVGSI